MFNENQFSFDLGESLQTSEKIIILKDKIIDRKSKYTIVAGKIESLEEVKKFIKNLNKDKYFQKSTHNTYAYIINEGGKLTEGKNDDGETGAGMCILRELKRYNAQNMIVVVTRYFGGIHLNTDRFKNVIDGTKIILEKIKNNEIK